MNRCFKIVFNKARGCLMVVNEITSSVQKSSAKSVLVGAMIATAGLSFGTLTFAYNNDTGHSEYTEITNSTNAKADPSKDYILHSSDVNTDYTILAGTDKFKAKAVNARFSIAIGAYSTVSAGGSEVIYESIAIGNGATSQSSGQTVLGSRADGNGEYATAIGYLSEVNGSKGVAFGYQAGAFGDSSIAIGSNAGSQGPNTIAFGTDSRATERGAIAIGYNSVSEIGDHGVAIGYAAKTRGGVSLGKGSNSTAYSVALGMNSSATNEYSSAVGYGTQVIGRLGTTIGYEAQSKNGGTAIGAQSLADVGASLGGYIPATKGVGTSSDEYFYSTAPAVSIGNAEKGFIAQINNVSAGSKDTDAVNVAQLKSLQELVKDTKVTVNTNQSSGNLVLTSSVDSTGTVPVTSYDVALSDSLVLGTAASTQKLGKIQLLGTKRDSWLNQTDYDTRIQYDGFSSSYESNTGNKRASSLSPSTLTFNSYGSDKTTVTKQTQLSAENGLLVGKPSDSGLIRISSTNIQFGDKQLHKVAAAEEDTDAVNLGQVKSLLPMLTVNDGIAADTTEGNLHLTKTEENSETKYNVKLSDQVVLGNETSSGQLTLKGSGGLETVVGPNGVTFTEENGPNGFINASGASFTSGIDISDSGISLAAKDLTSIGNASFESGISIGAVGIDANDLKITHVANAAFDDEAVNLGQLKAYSASNVMVSSYGQFDDGEDEARRPYVGNNILVQRNKDPQGRTVYDLRLDNHLMLGEDASDPAVVGYEHADGKIQFWRNGDSYTTLTSKGLELAEQTAGGGIAKFTSEGIDAGNQQIKGVAAGTHETDAVNFGQVSGLLPTLTVNDNAEAPADEGNLHLHSDGSPTGSIKYNIKLSDQIVLGRDGTAGQLTVKGAEGTQIEVAPNSITLTEAGKTTIINSSGATFANGIQISDTGVNVAGNRIQNVANPVEDTDAVNKGYLGQILGETGVIGTTVTVDGKSSVEDGNLQLTTKLDEAGKTNVYDLKLADNLNLGSETAPGSLTILGAEGKRAVLDASGLQVGSTTVADNSIKLGTDDADLALTKEQLSVGNVIVKNDALQAGGNVLNADGLTLGETSLRSTGLEIAGGPALSNTGLAMNSQKITGLVDGEAPDEAVNKSQLDKVAGAATVVEVADNNQNLTLDTAISEDTGAKVYTVRLADVLSFKDEAGNPATTLGKEGLTVGNTTVADNSIKIGDLRLTGESISLGNLNFNATSNELKIGDSVMKGDGFRIGNTIMDATGFHFAEGRGPRLTEDALDMGGKKIENLAQAIDDTQAVNFGQVKDLISKVSVEGGAANLKEGQNISVKSKTDIENKPYTEIALKDKISFQQDNHTLEMDGAGITLGNSSVRDNEVRIQENGSNSYASIKGTAIKVGTDSVNSELTQSSLRVGSSSLSSDKLVIGGSGRNGITITQSAISAAGKTIAFGNSGIDFGEAKLTGLVDGEDASDAATVGQLQAFYEYVESKLGESEPVQAVALNEKRSAKAMLKAAPLTAAPVALSAQINAVAPEETASVQPRADAVAYVAGKNISIQDNQIALAADIEVDSVKTKTAEVSEKVTVGTSNNAVVVADNAIYFKSETGPRISSGGIDAGNTRIQNVADAQAPTDAVNLRQLNQVGGRLMSRINDVDKRAKAGIAQAIATAGLPQAYQPGKAMAAAAGGTFGGESAIAIGVSKISDDGHWVFKGTFSGNTESKFGGSIGVGYQW